MTNKPARMVGTVRLAVEAREALPLWQRQLIAKGLEEDDAPNAQRYECAIAVATNEALAKGVKADVNGKRTTLTLARSGRALFGKKAKNDHPFLTVTVANADNPKQRWTVRWEGDAIPRQLRTIGVKHDEGKAAAECGVMLQLRNAKIVELAQDPRKNHDTLKNGEYRPRPHRPSHRKTPRIRRADL